MASIPIIRLELERMELSIIKALTEYAVTLDADIRAAVEAYCTPDNLKSVIARDVRIVADKVIAEEVERFYRHGPGREIVRKVMEESIAAGRAHEQEYGV